MNKFRKQSLDVGLWFDGNTAQEIDLTKLATNPAVQHIDALIFKGGGVRGIAFVGALEVLEEYNLTSNINKYAGSSVGAITAALLAVGYNAQSIRPILLGTDFSKFKDSDKWFITPQFLSDMWNIYYNMGIYTGDAFEKWIGKLIKEQTGDEDITFDGVYKRFGNWLETTGSNINARKPVYFNPSTYPDLPIRKAIRISMSVPGYFKPVLFDDDYYVDGGLLDNFPIDHFEKKHDDVKYTIGLRLVSSSDNERVDIKTGEQFAAGLIDAMCMQIERNAVRDFWHTQVCDIGTGSISSFNFDLSTEEKEKLIKSGREAMDQYVNS